MNRRQGIAYTCVVLTSALVLALALGHGCSTTQTSDRVDVGSATVPTTQRPPAPEPRQTQSAPDDAEPQFNLADRHVIVEVIDEWTCRVIPGAVLSWVDQGSAGSATTSPDGSASIPLAALRTGLQVEHAGYFPLLVQDTVPSGRLVAGKHRIEMTPRRMGQGVVVDTGGSPVEGARVLLRAEAALSAMIAASGGLWETSTNVRGEFEFPVSSRSRSLFVTTRAQEFANATIGPGVDHVSVVVRDGATLEVLVEGTGLSRIRSLQLRPQNAGPDVVGLDLYSEPVTDGMAVFRGLTPRSFAELTCPDLPDAVWSVHIGRPGSVTRLLILIDSEELTMHVRWTGQPVEPFSKVLVGLPWGGHRPAGRVVSQSEFVLPAYLAPFPRNFQLRFATAEGVVVGTCLRRNMRLVSEGRYECDAVAVFPIKGRVVDASGAPAAGAVVHVLSMGRAQMVSRPVTAGADGQFLVSVDNRFPMHVFAGLRNCSVVSEFAADTRDFGELRLNELRTVRVHLKGAPSDDLYYLGTRGDPVMSVWTAPRECRVGDSVDVPVSAATTGIVVHGRKCEIVRALVKGEDEIEIQVDLQGLTCRLRVLLMDETQRTTPFANATFSIGPQAKWETAHLGRPGPLRFATTDANGEAVIDGLPAGELVFDLESPRMPSWGVPAGPFEVKSPGQEIVYVVRLSKALEHYVSVVGTVRPVPEEDVLRIVALDRPLPRPMTGREIKGAGIRSSLISVVSFLGGAYGAQMDPNFPYIAIMVDVEGEVFDNAGYLVKIGDTWRADLVVPPRARDRVTGRAVLSAPPGAEAESPRLKLIWSEGGAFRGQDLPVTLDKELEFGWPRAAERVWLVASARSGEALMAAFIEPKATVTNRVELVAMPRIEVTGAQGLQGFVSLTPEGISPRRWISIAEAMAGKLVAAGVGMHELAGVDAHGVVRVSRVNVAAGPGTLALDLREVLTE